MYSSTKATITDTQIQALVRHAFGSGASAASINAIDSGMMNAVFHLSLSGVSQDASEVLLKVSFPPGADVLTYEHDIMKAEIQFYRHLADEALPIPVPRILFCDFSHRLIVNDYFFMTKLSGTPWIDLYGKLDEEDLTSLKEEFGRYTALMHSVRGSYFGYIRPNPQWHFSSWKEAYKAMVRRMIFDGKERKVPLPYEKVCIAIARHEALLDEIQTPSLVNFDLWPGNILLDRKENGRYFISGILDFERCFYGDPKGDFIASVMILDDAQKEEAFLRGYRQITGTELTFTERDQIRMDLYRVYLLLNLGIETYRFEPEYAAQTLKRVETQLNIVLDRLS